MTINLRPGEAAPASAVATALAAKLFRGPADPTRLVILLALTGGERRVRDLVEVGDLAQPIVSADLACLKDRSLVADRPQGRQVFYRLATPQAVELLHAAERLLAQTGQAIQLCPNYPDDQQPWPAPACG